MKQDHSFKGSSALSRGLMDEAKRQKLLETRTNEDMLAVLETDILTREDV